MNPTAAVCGCFTSALLSACERPWSRANHPPGGSFSFESCSAASTADAISSDTPGWLGCPLTMTGHPAASAEAVSPPTAPKAKGKLLAPKTAIGPRGRNIRRRSGLGAG